MNYDLANIPEISVSFGFAIRGLAVKK